MRYGAVFLCHGLLLRYSREGPVFDDLRRHGWAEWQMKLVEGSLQLPTLVLPLLALRQSLAVCQWQSASAVASRAMLVCLRGVA